MRGSALFALLGVLGPLRLSARSLWAKPEPLRVTLKVTPAPGESLATFHEDRSQFENLEKIIEVNRSYTENHRILSMVEHKHPDRIEWEYVFDSRTSFKEWNHVICSNGYFQREKVPAKYVIVGSED